MFNKELKKLNLVHDSDLIKLLESLNVNNDFNLGKKKCKFCSQIVNLENLHSLFKESGDIKFVCDSPDCIKRLMLFIE